MSKKNLFLPELKNKTSRSSFDLSRRVISSAKAGELLPCMVEDLIPGDSVKVNASLFTRLANLNTSNFARMNQYVNFYFVPYRLLFRDFGAFIVNRKEAAKQASSISSQHSVSAQLPHVHTDDLRDIFSNFVSVNDDGSLPSQSGTFTPCSINHNGLYALECNFSSTGDLTHFDSLAKGILNRFGFNRFDNSLKLLQYLGYYDLSNRKKINIPKHSNTIVNLFPLLAYQKVYCDFYRFNQWENDQPNTYNVDYLSGSQGNHIPIADLFTVQVGKLKTSLDSSDSFDVNFTTFKSRDANMFDLRYVNAIKDTLFGVVPSAQYGASSTVETSLSISSQRDLIGLDGFKLLMENATVDHASIKNVSPSADGGYFAGEFEQNTGVNSVGKFNIYKSDGINPDVPAFGRNGLLRQLATTFSIAQLRQAQALQKFREISLSNNSDYKSQIEAHFGVKVSSLMSSMCDYIGGFSAQTDVSTVANTNLTGGNVANYSALGSMSDNGEINFTAREHGLLIGVSYVLPLVDVQPIGFDKICLRTEFDDFALPEFDRLGNEEVDPRLFLGTSFDENSHLGFGPRYYDYKTNYDIVLGDFNANSGGTQPNFVVNFNSDPLNICFESSVPSDAYWRYMYYFGKSDFFNSIAKNSVDAYDFKVRPYWLNNIFKVAVGHGHDDFSWDQFYNVFDFTVKAVRNLDYKGMPY